MGTKDYYNRNHIRDVILIDENVYQIRTNATPDSVSFSGNHLTYRLSIDGIKEYEDAFKGPPFNSCPHGCGIYERISKEHPHYDELRQRAVKFYFELKEQDLKELFTINTLSKKNLTGINILYAYLSHCSFTGSNLENACLWGANLKNADLSNSNLQNVDLRYADLTGANLEGADLRSADLTGTIGLTVQQLALAVTNRESSLSIAKTALPGHISQDALNKEMGYLIARNDPYTSALRRQLSRSFGI